MSAGLVVGENDGSGSVSESASGKMQVSTATREWNSQRFAGLTALEVTSAMLRRGSPHGERADYLILTIRG